MAYTIKAHEISSVIRRQIAQYNEDMRVVNVGTVFQVGDGKKVPLLLLQVKLLKFLFLTNV